MTTHSPILLHNLNGGHSVNTPCAESVEIGPKILHPLQSRSQVIEKCLPRKSLIKLVGDHTGETITSLSGVVWITQTGEQEDIVLSTGEAINIMQKGSVLIEALAESRLKITSHSKE